CNWCLHLMLLLSGYASSRTLHSFPTRRSSDLGVVSLGEMTDRAGREAMAFATDSTASGLERRHVLFVDPDDGAVLAYEEILTGEDRKSTRLNSSHVKISYAVFCLKKKNDKPIL